MSQRAFMLLAKQGKAEVGTRAIPTPQGIQALVKVTATAINPIDLKQGFLPFITQFPAVLGLEAAGIIESVGPEVTRFKKGDRVLFQGQFQPSDVATFQQYALADTDVMALIPDNLTDDQAATVPVGSITSMFGLFQRSNIVFPETGPTASGKSIFVFGGSSSVGQYALQFARIAGFSTIATTASTKHTYLLKSLGATHIYDRNIALETIQSELSLPFDVVFDAVPTPEGQALAVELLTTPSPAAGARYASVQMFTDERKAKFEGKVVCHSIFGSSHVDKALSVPYWKLLTQWLEEGKLVPNNVHLVSGGLNGISEGFELSKKGVSGVKLVVRPQE